MVIEYQSLIYRLHGDFTPVQRNHSILFDYHNCTLKTKY
nr:MAG TPA: hypothetical protein [Caudoviricetes sp.]